MENGKRKNYKTERLNLKDLNCFIFLYQILRCIVHPFSNGRRRQLPQQPQLFQRTGKKKLLRLKAWFLHAKKKN